MTSRTESTGSMETTALLGAFCLFLSAVEMMIPKPLPFLRLGLANLPILLGLTILSPGQVLSLVGIKILGQGLVNGTLFSYIFLFSAAGSLASGLVMLSAYHLGKRFFSFIGISLFGALASGLVQLLFSRLTVFGENAWIIAPPFLAAGGVTAILLGLFAGRFSSVSVWMKELRTGVKKVELPAAPGAPVSPTETDRPDTKARNRWILMETTPPGFRFICGLIIMLCFIFQNDLYIRIGLTVFFTVVSILSGKRYRFLPSATMVLVITLVNLLSPQGRLLFTIGTFPVTLGALETGLLRGFLLAGLIVISRGFVSSKLQLPGAPGRLLGMTFQYFEEITESKGSFDPGKPVKSLDDMMRKIQTVTFMPGSGTSVKDSKEKHKPVDILIPIITAIGSLIAFFG